MSNDCPIPKTFNSSLVQFITFIIFIIGLVISFLRHFYDVDLIFEYDIYLILIFLWIIFVFFYSKVRKIIYIKKIYRIEGHPCNEILKEFLLFISNIFKNDDYFQHKKLIEYIKNNFCKKYLNKRNCLLLIKSFIKKLIKEKELEIFEE